MEQWKLDKLKSLTNEVKELHPVLRSLFSKDPSISRFEYTHGPNEMGADFVLARPDPTLDEESYIGLIVKSGDIKQDFSDVTRQIEECEVERFFDNGKKKIYLNEIWVVCNGSISNNAEKKIYEKYKAKNIKFINLQKLATWIDKHYLNFWDEVTTELSDYFEKIINEINQLESSHSITNNIPILEIESKLIEIRRKKFSRPIRIKNKEKVTLPKILETENFLIIEGGMGTGKSTLFRRYIKSLTINSVFQKEKILPVLMYFKDISNNILTSIQNKIEELNKIFPDKKDIKKYIFIDGLDEVQDNSSFLNDIPEIHEFINNNREIKIIFGSRPMWDIEDEEILFKYLKRYSISPLSTEQLYKVIQFTCSELNKSISDRLMKDLHRSENTLLRTLPKTPMSAILLARVLSSDVKELPQTLPELYSKYIELSLGRWDITRGLMVEREYPIILKFLGNLSIYMLDNQLHEIAISEVKDQLREYINAREGLPSADELLNKIFQRTEIININKAKSTFMFRHKSFAEYLYALSKKDESGKNAKFNNPFDVYWLGVEYFYLGLIQDCGQTIKELSSLSEDFSEKERMFRAFNLSDFMLAAYQTEYNYIEEAMYNIYLDMANLFIQVKNQEIKSILSIFPEFQLFTIISLMMKDRYEYEYFKKALANIQIQCQYDQSLNAEKKYIMSFLIDITRYGLNENDAFMFLTDKKLTDLPWVVKLGIKHIEEKEKNKLPHLQKLVKKILKSTKANMGLTTYIKNLYEKPIIEPNSLTNKL
ncbi:MAG: NACHT domain-containing protein [Peptoanaerobacter stomatis]